MAHEVSRESAAYNVQFALHIDGTLRVDALRRSLQHLVDRHEALRTTFRTEANELQQVVAPSGSIELRTISVPEQDSAAECIENLMLAEATHRFDLRNGPLMRATLVACASREHVLLLNMHHIVTDGWSMRVFFDELRLLYEAFCSNATLPSGVLPPLRAQYRHYTLWQAEWMKDVTFDEQLSYWKKELAGVAPILALPTKPRQAKMTDAGAVRGFTIPRHVVDELSAFSQRNSVTLFMTLLAAFQIVLFRHTDQTDIVVGTAVGNRTDVDTDGLIGLFLNTVPVRVQLERHATVAEVVSQVRGKALGAYANQDVPFDRLLQELRPARSRGYQPLVQVYFAMQNAVLASPTMEALAVRMIKTPVVYAKFDLAVAVRTTANGIEGSAEYRTALFEASTIDRFFDDLLGVLDVVIADPETKLSNVILRSQLLDSPLAI
jgi:hypothetical protein